MTISTTTSSIQTPGNGFSTVFTFPMKIFAATDLVVGFITSSGYILQSAYTVTNVDVNGGGTVTFTTAPPSGTTVDIRTFTPQTQGTEFANLGTYSPQNQTEVADRLTREIQDLYRLTYAYGIHGPDTESTPWPALPAPSGRAGLGLGFDGTGTLSLVALLASALTQSQFNAFLAVANTGVPPYAATVAEATAGVSIVNPNYPIGNMIRYGLVPNNASSATSNTAILQTLFNPSVAGPTGSFVFPNTTGADTYYVNAVVAIRDNVHIDLGGCTINCTQTAAVADTNSGMFFAIRDFSCENGKVTVMCDTTLASSCGYAFQFGARASESARWPVAIYDSLLGSQMGKIHLSNVHVTINNTGPNLASSGAVAMVGGLRDVLIENVTINGSNTCAFGLYYEFGWATNPPATGTTQTSHAHNIRFKNVDVTNLSTAFGAAVTLSGAYNASVENLYANSVTAVFNGTPGESLFYNPWVGKDDVGTKHTIALKNIVGEAVAGTGITLTGAESAAGTYLASTIAGLSSPANYIVQTDLCDYVLEGFRLSGTANGFGVSTSATKSPIRAGYISGFQRGIVTTDEHTQVDIDGVTIVACTQAGINMQGGGTIWGTPRLKTGSIRNCFIGGNGTSSVNTYPGILAYRCAQLVIEACRINYEAIHDGAAETTQGNAIQVDPTCFGVVCRNNYVGTVIGGSFAYYTSGTAEQGLDIQSPDGTFTYSGKWDIQAVAQATGTQLATAANAVNTYGKFIGRLAYNTTITKLFVAQGATATSTWISVDAATTITPS